MVEKTFFFLAGSSFRGLNGIMKKIISILLSVSILAAFAGASVRDTSLDGRREIARKLYGKIKIVANGADYKVRFVSHSADLRVKIVTSFPDEPGLWKIVERGQDFKIKPTDYGEDVRVMLVDAFAGPTD